MKKLIQVVTPRIVHQIDNDASCWLDSCSLHGYVAFTGSFLHSFNIDSQLKVISLISEEINMSKRGGIVFSNCGRKFEKITRKNVVNSKKAIWYVILNGFKVII